MNQWGCDDRLQSDIHWNPTRRRMRPRSRFGTLPAYSGPAGVRNATMASWYRCRGREPIASGSILLDDEEHRQVLRPCCIGQSAPQVALWPKYVEYRTFDYP